jgi:hypothetical protein
MTDRDSEILTRAEARLGTVLLGKYRLDRVLGIGGMAVVYKATHRNQAQLAVKMLHPEMSLSADIRSRFLREGYAANSIQHPGAVLVVDDDVAEDGAAFLVMELLDGIGCEQLLERSGTGVSPEAASAILIQLLDVLASAHAAGIVHRDIKPANLFLTRNGVVKVLDFGIARAREALAAGAHATGTGMMLGTPAFMAPEQALGRSREIDGRTDLWAAGATFFSLVSGQFVHNAETAQELMVKAATQPARSLASAAPHESPVTVGIIDRALAFQREDRWESAQAMRDALINARPEGAPSPEAIVASLVPGSIRPAQATVVAVAARQPTPVAVGAVGDRPPARRSGPTAVALTTSAATSSDGGSARARPYRRWVIGGGGALGLALVLALVIDRPRPEPKDARAVADTSPSLGSAGRIGSVGSTSEATSLDAEAACAPASSRCNGGAQETCTSAGQWSSGVITAGECGAACAPGSTPPQCTGSIPQTCGPTGQWVNGAACSKSKSCRDGVCVTPSAAGSAQTQVAPPTSTSTSPKPNCDPPFTLDENGQKHFKAECFR